MRIAYLSTFYPYRGGIAQFNANLYRALISEGNQVDAYTFSRQYPDFLFPGKTQLVTENDIADPIPALRLLDSISPYSWYKTASYIKKTNPDILLMKYWMSYMAPCLGTVAGSMKKNTTVLTVVDNAIPHERKFFDNAFASYFLNRNDKFIAMSESVKNDILSIKKDAQILVREHPLYDHFGALVDQKTAREKLGIPTNKKTVLFFGFIRDYKGLDVLIESFENMQDDIQLIIAGESYGSFDHYKNLIEKNKNKNNIYPFVRYIDDNEVPLFFGASDAVVLPYKSATQSGISAIAHHFEIPIIATDVGGLKETIEHEKSGIIISQAQPNLIAEGIRNFYNHNEVNWQVGIQKIKEELSWEKFANAITDFAKS